MTTREIIIEEIEKRIKEIEDERDSNMWKHNEKMSVLQKEYETRERLLSNERIFLKKLLESDK